jgi:hypothetical protein
LSKHPPRSRESCLDRRLGYIEDFRNFALRQSLSSLEKKRLRVLRRESREKFKCLAGFRSSVPIGSLASPRRRKPRKRFSLNPAIARSHARFIHRYDAQPPTHTRRIANVSRLREKCRGNFLQQVFDLDTARRVRRKNCRDPSTISTPNRFDRFHFTLRCARVEPRLGKVCDFRRPLVVVQRMFTARVLFREARRHMVSCRVALSHREEKFKRGQPLRSGSQPAGRR